MKIPHKILTKIKASKEHGDIQGIADQSRINRRTVSRAFKNGQCSPETFEAIRKFYTEKKKAEKELSKEVINDLD